MAIPSNGITAEVIQELMPQFIIGDDLIGGILDAIPAPPAGASVAWRHARIARIIEETTALLPADAAQARHAAQIVILRDVADDTMRCSHAVTGTAMTVEQMCRVRRTADKLICTAERLERALYRRQQLPTPFWGNVAPHAHDVAALDAKWCREALHRATAGGGAGGEADGDRCAGVAVGGAVAAGGGRGEEAGGDAGPREVPQGPASPGMAGDEPAPIVGPILAAGSERRHGRGGRAAGRCPVRLFRHRGRGAAGVAGSPGGRDGGARRGVVARDLAGDGGGGCHGWRDEGAGPLAPGGRRRAGRWRDGCGGRGGAEGWGVGAGRGSASGAMRLRGVGGALVSQDRLHLGATGCGSGIGG